MRIMQISSTFNLFSAVLLLLTLTLDTESASIWYTGENKPYNFGYTIEGNQHRRESKDIYGRINGEYGFITADNVYHVTVYATDENGNFKIISMKNIKLHQLPDLSKSAASTTVQPFTVKTTSNSFDSTTTDLSQKGEPCASCLLPPKLPVETVKPTVVNDDDSTTTIPPPFKIVSKNDPPDSEKNVNQNVENSLSNEASRGSNNNQNQQSQNSLSSNANSRQPSLNEKLNSYELSNKLQGTQQLNNGKPGNNELLYRFDYATDYHGHKEEGDQLGNKNGEFFSIGRDNVKRIVSYNANEFGFMPHIRQQPISQQYNDNQLRHYNFEWFYPKSVLYG